MTTSLPTYKELPENSAVRILHVLVNHKRGTCCKLLTQLLLNSLHLALDHIPSFTIKGTSE